MFSPIRRSSLYFELVRFDIQCLQFANNIVADLSDPKTGSHFSGEVRVIPGTARSQIKSGTGHLLHRGAGSIAKAGLWRQRVDMSTSRSTLPGTVSKRAAMSQSVTPRRPEECQTMAEVRTGVDAVDLALIDLLAKRFGYMDAAARIKADRSDVRDEVRKAQVLVNVTAAAETAGLPIATMVSIWEELVEASIAYELERWDDIGR